MQALAGNNHAFLKRLLMNRLRSVAVFSWLRIRLSATRRFTALSLFSSGVRRRHFIKSALHGQKKTIERQRLFNKVKGAEFGRGNRRMDIAVTGNHHDVYFRRLVLNLFEQLDTVDLRHPNVEEHEPGFFPLNQLAHASAIGGVDDVISLVAQDLPHGFTDVILIVHNQNRLSNPLFLPCNSSHAMYGPPFV